MPLHHLIRAAILFVAIALAGPTLAQSDLEQFAGNWTGSGQVTGAESGAVTCRLQFVHGNDGKLRYNGRCSFTQGTGSFAGTLAYDAAAKRYVAVGSGQGVKVEAVGKMRGSAIVFDSGKMSTEYGEAKSVLSLAPGRIELSFEMVDTKGEKTSAAVALSKG